VTYKGPYAPQMRQFFDSGCSPRLRSVELDVDYSAIWLNTFAKLPSLRHVVAGRPGPYYTPYNPVNNSTLTTLEMYRIGSIDHYSPPAGEAHGLQHLRLHFLREARAGAEEGLFQWRYPLLRTLHLRLRQGYCGAKYPARLLPGTSKHAHAMPSWLQ